ncbi:MAG TPA: dienelactone hydrolase family protein [Azospirillaceae bacterium]|nr:dienelactone hydrolase family protein [Azospirillaceae bacterium]
MKAFTPALLAAAAVASVALTPTAGRATSPDSVKPHLTVSLPSAGKAPYPVVFFLQGAGGGNHRANRWAQDFAAAGIASVAIDNAGLRGVSNIARVETSSIAGDYAAALTALQGDKRLDLKRHAVMGFSKGATAAMQSGPTLGGDQPKPRLVAAFYPGVYGDCSKNLPAGVKTVIFYGSADQWGEYRGTRDACRRLAQQDASVAFHPVEGAHHGFDDAVTMDWTVEGRTYRSQSDPAARALVKDALLPILKDALK